MVEAENGQQAIELFALQKPDIRLFISEDTVKGHIRKILQKLKANDRAHAVTIPIKRGFFDL